MTFTGFPPETLQFYADLTANNEKAWFEAHRSDYEAYVMAPARSFVVAIGERLRELAPDVMADPRVNKSIFRIYRDTRFSKDKTPYKTNLALWFPVSQGGAKFDHPGYYFHLEAGNLMLGAGFPKFSPTLLKAYREAVIHPRQGPSLAERLAALEGKGYQIGGKTYKRTPRGYDPDHPLAELLLFSGLTSSIDLGIPPELHQSELVETCFAHYRNFAPIVDWLEVLTK